MTHKAGELKVLRGGFSTAKTPQLTQFAELHGDIFNENITWLVYCSEFNALKNILVAMRHVETPVPIPNTMVKHMSADDTWLETARESRWLPDSLIKTRKSLYISKWQYAAGAHSSAG